MEEEEVSKTAEQEQDTEKKTTDESRDILIEFIRDLRALLPKKEVEQFLWISKAGLFIKEEFISNVERTFDKWFFKKTDVRLDAAKITRKIFGEAGPREFYLIVGSSVVIGTSAPCPTNGVRGAGIRLYEGIPLDTAQTLHHTDPIFLESDRLTVSLSRQGFLITVKTKFHSFVLDLDMANQLRNYFRDSGDCRKYIDSRTLRRFVRSFAECLERAKRVDPNRMMVVPVKCGKDFRGILFQIGSSILVEYEGRLVDSFGVEGRGYELLVRDELVILADEFGRKKISGAALSVKKGSFLAHYDILGIHHTFGISAFFSFLRATDDYFAVNKRMPGKLKGKITVRDVIPEITTVLRDAQPVLIDKVPNRIKDEMIRTIRNKGSCLVSKGEWFFIVDQGKMIRDIYFQPRAEVKPIVTPIIPPSSSSPGELGE